MRFESVAWRREWGDRSSFVQGEARLESGEDDKFWRLETWRNRRNYIGPNRGTIPIVEGDDFSHTRTLLALCDDEILFPIFSFFQA